MAFPAIADSDTTSGTVTSNDSSWTLTYPANIAAGDLVLGYCAADGTTFSPNSTDWNEWELSEGTCGLGVFARIATGSLSGTFECSGAGNSEQGSWRVVRIPASQWSGGSLPADGAPNTQRDGDGLSIVAASGASSSPAPPSLNPANWATEDTLWLVLMACDGSRTVSGFPTNYTPGSSGQEYGSLVSGGANGASLGWGERNEATGQVTPGTFTISTSDGWAAATVAIRPAGASTQTITLGLLDSGPALYAPTVAAGAVSVTLPVIQSLSYAESTLSRNPAGLWLLAEPSGTTADDATATGNDGTYHGTYTQGQAGVDASATSVDFDGTSGYVDIPDQLAYSVDVAEGRPGLSVEAWAYIDTTPDLNFIVSKAGNPDYFEWGIGRLSGGAIRFTLWDAGGAGVAEIDTTATPSAGWHHLAMVVDGTNQALVAYIDGAEEGRDEDTWVNTPTETAALVNIGRRGDGASWSYWPHRIQRVAVYSYALDEATVLRSYNAGLAGGSGGVAYAPTLTPVVASQTVTVGLIDAGPTLYAPTLVYPQPVTVGLIDASSAIYAPTLASGAVSVVLPLLVSSATYPPDTTISAPTTYLDDYPRPGYLSELVDSEWGTRIKRISNTNLYRHQYAGEQPWNKDGSRLMLKYGDRILDGNTYADLGAMTTWADMVRWSNVNADYAYGIALGDPRLRRYSVSGNSWSDLVTFSGTYPNGVDMGGYDGNLSDNDRVALIGNNGGAYSVFVYDIPNATVLGTLAITGATPTSCKMSRSGDYVIVHHAANGSGTFQGAKLYNASDMSLVRTISQGREHSDAGKDAAGADIFVFITVAADSGGANIVRSHRLSDGTNTDLWGVGETIYGIGHISCANYDRPGWAYMSCNDIDNPSYGGFQQIVAVKTDGSETVEVFAFEHATGGPDYYDHTPLASTSRTGDRVIWAAPWAATLGENPVTAAATYAYIARAGTGGQSGPEVFSLTLTPKLAIAPPLIDSGSALYAPTILPQPVGVTVGVIESTSAVYAPTLVAGPVTLTVGLIDSGPALYAPTLLGKNALTVGLVDAGAALYAPTLLATYSLTPPLIDAGAAVYAPSLAVGPVTVDLGLVDSGSAIYEPTVQQAAGGTQTVTPGLIDAEPAVYAVTIAVGPVTVGLDLVDSGAAVYQPTLTPGPVAVSLGLVDAGGAIYDVTLVAGPMGVYVDLIDAGPAVYAPTLISDQLVSLDLVDSGSALYQPTLSGVNALLVGLIDAGSAIYDPTLAVGPVTVDLGLIDASSAVYEPILSEFQTLAPDLLDGGATAYAPTLTGVNAVSLGLIDSGAAVYAPALTTGFTLTPPLIDAGPALYAPAIIADQIVLLPVVDGGAAVYELTVLAGGFLGPQLIDAGAALYAPTLTVGPVGVSLGLIDAAGGVFAPTLVPGAVGVTVGLIDGTAVVYAPELTKQNLISLGLLDGSATAYAPTILPGAVGIGLTLLDGIPSIYAPHISQGVVRTVFMRGRPGGTLAPKAAMAQKTPRTGPT